MTKRTIKQGSTLKNIMDVFIDIIWATLYENLTPFLTQNVVKNVLCVNKVLINLLTKDSFNT